MRQISRRHLILAAVLYIVVTPSRARAGAENLIHPFVGSAADPAFYSPQSKNESVTSSPTVAATFGRFVPDSREIFLSILPWHWKGYLPAVATGAGTIPLVIFKNDVQRQVDLSSGEDLPFIHPDAFYARFEFLGNNTTLPALSMAFILGGVAAGSHREVETGLMLAQSLLFTAAVTGLGQLVLAEDRPFDGGDMGFFRMNGHGVSGHSSVAASMVKPLDAQYLTIRDDDRTAEVVTKWAGKVFLHAAPLMVGVTRVRSNKHYVWNVVLGLSAGYWVGKIVADVHGGTGEEDARRARRWCVAPHSDGMSICLEW